MEWKGNPIELNKQVQALGHPSHTDGPQEVIEGIWIGSAVAANNKFVLDKLKITHLLTVAVDVTPKYLQDFNVCQILINDHSTVDLIQFFPFCIQFIKAVISSGGRILVHCIAGKSRSASVVIAYLMATQNLSFRQAYNKLQKIRNVINPNEGFISQLKQFEAMNCTLEKALSPQNSVMIKFHYKELPKEFASGGNLDFTDKLSCTNCKKSIFSKSEIGHVADNKKKYCSAFYIRGVTWMTESDMEADQGTLFCPHCQYEIGKWKWSGVQCTCGNWVVPAFVIYKGVVE